MDIINLYSSLNIIRVINSTILR